MAEGVVKLSLDNSEFQARVAESEKKIDAFSATVTSASNTASAALNNVAASAGNLRLVEAGSTAIQFGEASAKGAARATEALAMTARQAARTAEAMERAARSSRSDGLRLGARGGFAVVPDIEGPNVAEATARASAARASALAHSAALRESALSARMATAEMIPLAQRTYAADAAFAKFSAGAGKGKTTLAEFGMQMVQTAGRIALPDWVLFKINAIAAAMKSLGGIAAVAIGVSVAVIAAAAAVAYVVWKKASDQARESTEALNAALDRQRELVRLAAERNRGFYGSADPLRQLEKSWQRINDRVNAYTESTTRAINAHERMNRRDKDDVDSEAELLAARARRVAAERMLNTYGAGDVAEIEKERDAYLARLEAAKAVRNAEADMRLARERVGVMAAPVPTEGLDEAEKRLTRLRLETEAQGRRVGFNRNFPELGMGDLPLQGGKALDQAIERAGKLRDAQLDLLKDATKDNPSAGGAFRIAADNYEHLVQRLESYKRSLAEIADAEKKREAALAAHGEATSKQMQAELDARAALVAASRRLEAAKENERTANLRKPEHLTSAIEIPLPPKGADRLDVIASSLAKVGGGGLYAVTGPSDPLLAEGRRQSAILERIERNTSFRQGDRSGSSFALRRR